MLASGCARKAHPGGSILLQYIHGSVPGGGERTLYVVVLESRAAWDRCEDFPVALTLLTVRPYVEVEGLLLDV